MKKIIIEIETERPQAVETYLREVLNTLSRNSFLLIKNFAIKIVEK